MVIKKKGKFSKLVCLNANHRERQAKILVYRSKVLRCFLIDLVLSNHTQMQKQMIDVIWESKGATFIIWQRKMRSGTKYDILEYLETSSSDVSMEIVDAAAIVHIWSEPSTLQIFNNT